MIWVIALIAFGLGTAVMPVVERIWRQARLLGFYRPAPLFPRGYEGARPTFFALLRLDRHKLLRHQLGHDLTVEALEALAPRIKAKLAAARIVRIGRAEIEFTFTAADADEADRRLAELQGDLEQVLERDGRRVALTVTIGYADSRRCSESEAVLVEQAEVALERARVERLKRAMFGPDDRINPPERLALMGDLGKAIEREEMFLCYQPKLRARTDAIEAVEALIRWRHPWRGLIPPEDFIGLAEESGEIRELTQWVLDRAIQDQKRLREAGHDLAIDMNISGRLLADRSFIDWALIKSREARGTLGFEITETAVIDDPENALRNVNLLADAGIRIGIDDYGKGLSSLAYLKRLPAKELKLDRMFVSRLTSSNRDPLLVRSTIDLAHALEMEVTAEGVESPAALALLRVMGCDLMQGFLIGRPIPIDELIPFLAQRESNPQADAAEGGGTWPASVSFFRKQAASRGKRRS